MIVLTIFKCYYMYIYTHSHLKTHVLQDGTSLQFKSVTTQKYLCAESGGGTIIVANRTSASGWETFKVSQLILNYFCFN